MVVQDEDESLLRFFPAVMRLKETRKRIHDRVNIDLMDWEVLIARQNWTSLGSMCEVVNTDDGTDAENHAPTAVITDTELPKSVVEWDWGTTKFWLEQQCRLFLLHFAKESRRKVVIHPGKSKVF